MNDVKLFIERTRQVGDLIIPALADCIAKDKSFIVLYEGYIAGNDAIKVVCSTQKDLLKDFLNATINCFSQQLEVDELEKVCIRAITDLRSKQDHTS